MTATQTGCDRCTKPVGEIVQCDFADPRDDGDQDLRMACEACRPESHYATCTDCKNLILKDKLTYHTTDTGQQRRINSVLVIEDQRISSVRDIKVSSLCWVCDNLAKQRNERELAGYKDPPYGDEH